MMSNEEKKEIKNSSTHSKDADDKTTTDSLHRCILILENASNDTEKFAALLMVTKLIKTDSLNTHASKMLMDAIGLNFLERMLTTKDVPEGCPPYIFKSIALTILSCFLSTCDNQSSVYNLIPHITEIIANIELYDDDQTLIKETFQCLKIVASESTGREAMIINNNIGLLIDVYVDDNIFHDDALEIIRVIATDSNCNMWQNNAEYFSKCMEQICKEFCENQDDYKFYLCEIISDILYSNIENIDNDIIAQTMNSWVKFLHKGLSDILFSKLNQSYRNKGLHLASVILEVLGLSFIVNGGEKGHQLLLVMVHLACIEVRMSLEDKSFQESVVLAGSTTACYSIMEEAIKFLINGAFDLEGRQKQQLYSALKGAFSGVLEFLNGAAVEDIFGSSYKTQIFIYASIKVLAAWLAEETTANKEEIYGILPFLIKVAKHNFDQVNSKKTIKKKVTFVNRETESEDDKGKYGQHLDILRFLFPGLCHLTAEDHPRQILLQLDIEHLLLDYLNYQCNQGIICNLDAVITVCNIFMNIVVQEPLRVKNELVYYILFKFILSKIAEITNNGTNLLLSGCLSTLGLMVFRHQFTNISKADMSVYRFIQSTVRFLWDGYNVEESTDYATLVVSSAYESIWSEAAEFWFLSIQTLTALISQVEWIPDFLIESDWPQTIVETFLLIKEGGIESPVKTAYEDFLCALIQYSKVAKEILLIKGVATICKNHNLVNLLEVISKKGY